MKKLIVAVLIVGTFIMYSFTHRGSNSAALVSVPTVDTGTVANVVTPTAAGASNSPPASTAASLAAIVTTTPTPADPNSDATAASAPPTPTPRPAPTIVPTPTSPPGSAFKDGTYTGTVADAQWGYVQVKAVISQGRIATVQFLQFPSDRSRSQRINAYADPVLINEAIQAQSAQVDIITGATDSSEAFIQSLSDALTRAQA